MCDFAAIFHLPAEDASFIVFKWSGKRNKVSPVGLSYHKNTKNPTNFDTCSNDHPFLNSIKHEFLKEHS